MKHSLKVIFTLIGVSLVVPTYVQGGAVFDFSANFFIALIAGILLAFGFQALLTLLSVAAGINFTGPFNKQSSGSEQKSRSENNSSGGSSGSIGPKISSAAGAWTLLTVSLSLFFASWLAIKLTLVESNTIGLVLGLVIWAAFYTTMMYLELKSVSSLAGGLFYIAIGSVKSSISGIKSVFEANQQKQHKGTKALFQGINIAYDEDNSRSFLKENGITLLFTFGAIILAIICMTLIIGFPALGGNLGLPPIAQTLISIGRWVVLGAIIVFWVALIYKVAPVRKNPQFRWVSSGAVIATFLWLVGSWAFSFYVSNFGSYNKTYGSVAAIVILMLWFFLSAFVILLGAEINSEMEQQTRKDTTVGESQPMGEREAYHADHVSG